MKMTVKPKMAMKAKPGQLLRTTIEYGEGDSASVHHEHEPAEQKKGEPWTPGATPLKKHFSSRGAAHQHAAQAAGLTASLDDHPEPADIGEQENEEAAAGAANGPVKTDKRKYVQPSGLGS